MKHLIIILSFFALTQINAQSTIAITMNGVECCPTHDTYTAILTQNETEDIEATVLENTYDYNVVWIREGVGVYYCAGAFVENRTVIEGFNTEDTYQSIGFSNVYMKAYVEGGRIYIRFYGWDEENVELSDLDSTVSISFRTYP